MGKKEGQDWATSNRRPKASITVSNLLEDREDFVACFSDTKGLHYIPQSYKHTMSTDPDRWTAAIETKIATLKANTPGIWSYPRQTQTLWILCGSMTSNGTGRETGSRTKPDW